MSEIHVVVGASLLSFGAATGAYLSYNLFNLKKNGRSNSGNILVLLSETLIAAIIGILHIYCYSCECSEESFTDMNELLNQTRQSENDVEECKNSIECMYQKMLVEQLVLTIAIIHSFVSLFTSSSLCNKPDSCLTNDEPSTSRQNPVEMDSIQSIIYSLIAQWTLPVLSAIILCFVIQMPDQKSMCEIPNLATKIPENFQNLVSELLEKPMNTTEQSMYDSEIQNIVGKVYSIVDSATHPTDIKGVTNLDEGFEILNIIERMNSQNYRTPKQIKIDYFTYNDKNFKIYTAFLILAALIPTVYSNSTHSKLKIMFQMNKRNNKNTNTNLHEKMKYLKMSIIAAGALWTPSMIETFARTFITQTHPNITMHILMAVGSSYMLVRYGINLKLLKSFTGQQNTIVPKA